MTLNITVSDVPTQQNGLQAFVRVLGDAISEAIPGQDDTVIRSLGGVPVVTMPTTTQISPDNLVVDFIITIARGCILGSCDTDALELIDTTKGALDDAFHYGTLTGFINFIAYEDNVPPLYSAAVLGLQHIGNTTFIDEDQEDGGDNGGDNGGGDNNNGGDDGNNDGPGDSSSAKASLSVTAFLVSVGSLLGSLILQ